MESMRTLRTREHLAEWRRDAGRYTDERERIGEAGSLLVGLIFRKAAWRTEAFFDILYGDVGSKLQLAAAAALNARLELMHFSGGFWTSGPSISMTRQCLCAGHFDVFAELVKRGPPPHAYVYGNYASTTPGGAWLDTLSSLRRTPQTYPEAMRMVQEDCEKWVGLLVDADPDHEHAEAMQGTVAGAAFAELIMKRTLASRQNADSQMSVPATTTNVVGNAAANHSVRRRLAL